MTTRYRIKYIPNGEYVRVYRDLKEYPIPDSRQGIIFIGNGDTSSEESIDEKISRQKVFEMCFEIAEFRSVEQAMLFIYDFVYQPASNGKKQCPISERGQEYINKDFFQIEEYKIGFVLKLQRLKNWFLDRKDSKVYSTKRLVRQFTLNFFSYGKYGKK